MSYTIKQARPVLLKYLGLTEQTATFINDTDKWGILFEKDSLKCVIFMMPLGENTSSPKIYFDIRDSGAEKFVAAWNYAVQNKYKFFCLGVKDENPKYKDYIISVEADIQTVLKVSGLENGRRSGTGTQLNIPSTLIPKENITRVKSNKFDIFFAVVNKDYIFTYLEVFDNRLFQVINASKKQNYNVIDTIGKPRNRIIFGAPGTGKSHKLENDRDICFGSNYERVTFHPNYSYAQFVGSYKPIMQRLNNVNIDVEEIKYEYVPGPFIRTLIKAYKTQKVSFNITNERVFIITNNRNTSGWDYYKEVTGPGFVEEWWKPHSQARINDKVLLYLGKSYEKNGVFAIGTIISEPYDVPEENGKRIKIRFDYTSFDEPIFTEKTINENVPTRRIESWIDETEHGKKLLNNYSKNNNYLLLIEEINRANVAAVFGDVFQLLDRDEYGNSEYPITTSEDLRKFLAKPENLGGTPEDYETISIPSNMYIWATMNSADQGVFPMDTAFKRRWEFEYIGIDDNEKEIGGVYIPVCREGNVVQKVIWNDLRKAINNKLITLGINEDKLLGPFFLSKSLLESAMDRKEEFVKLFESKVLMYLFEDAAKMKVRSLFNVDKFIYSEVCKKFEKDGLSVFIFNDEDKVACEDIKSEYSSNGELFANEVLEDADE